MKVVQDYKNHWWSILKYRFLNLHIGAFVSECVCGLFITDILPKPLPSGGV